MLSTLQRYNLSKWRRRYAPRNMCQLYENLTICPPDRGIFSQLKVSTKAVLFTLTILFGLNILMIREESFEDTSNIYVAEGNGEASFVDLYFQPLMKAFKLVSKQRNFSAKQFRSGSQPTFLLIAENNLSGRFWQQQLLHISRNQCPLPCSFTSDKSKASSVDSIVFYLRDFENVKSMTEGLPERDYSQPWIMLSFEAALKANHYYANYSIFNGVFNRTMMHRTDADVFTPHGFIVKNEDVHFLPNDWVLPTVDETILNAKKLNESKTVMAFISNCNAGGGGRLNYVKEMQKHINVDVHGNCGKLECGSSRFVDHAYEVTFDDCFLMAAKKYLFYLAFENAICKDYGSEKLYNLLYYPIVPIVLGGANYQDILPPNSYINAANYSPKELAKYLIFLKNNPEKYMEFLHWRTYYKSSTVGGIRSMCHLCFKLYESSFYEYHNYKDFYKWFFLDSNCFRRWTNSTSGIVHLPHNKFY